MADDAKNLATLSPNRQALFTLLRAEQEHAALLKSRIPRRSHAGGSPLSYAQERLWFLHKLEPGSVAYNLPFAWRLCGALNVAALEQSLNEILRRHEAVRTTYSQLEEKPIQIIGPPAVLSLAAESFEHVPADERETELQRWLAREAAKPFDLSCDLLMRASLMRLTSREHVLLINLHHIAADGWSMSVLTRELESLYLACCEGRSPILPELPIQYADFAVWQKEWIEGRGLVEEVAYWRSQIEGAPSAIALPSDRPRPAAQSYRGARHQLCIPTPVREELKLLAKRENATLFMVLMAAFQTLLHRYTRQETILVGAPICGRNWSEVEPLIGFFANTLVLRADFKEDLPFRELLARVRETTLEAFTHQALPFDRLVQELQPERVLSQNPLFQVSFDLRDSTPGLRLPGLQTTLLHIPWTTTQFDLTLFLTESERGLTGAFTYSTDLFEPTTIERLEKHLLTLLNEVVSQPNQKVSLLALLTEQERKQILSDFNATRRPYPRRLGAHQLFEEQAAAGPDRVALECRGARMSYRELNTRANQLACSLQDLGAGPGVAVGLCMDRSPEMVIGLLAVLKAGGAYLPLDPGFPRERLAYLMKDAQVSLLLTDGERAKTFREFTSPTMPHLVFDDLKLLAVAGESRLQPQPVAAAPVIRSQPEHLAYIIYTSGSTGAPKGVAIEHQALVNCLCSMRERPGLTSQDAWLAITPLTFDIATLEILLPLSVGARLVLASHEEASDVFRLQSILAESDATVLQATPATWQMLVESGWPGNKRLRGWCGGEALSRALADQLLPRVASLWNMYGPTETTIWSTVEQVESGTSPVSIGRPIANTETYILDACLQAVPVGVRGELHIGGDGLARGYWNRPELTAERFIPHPFAQQAGKRLYRTGDWARFRPDGRIDFLGRPDDQVKIRGFRIELGEVEAALRQHPLLRDVAVAAREDPMGNRQLVAYFTLRQEAHLPESVLRAFLREKLPDYMVPNAFVRLENLPLTPHGKVDRRALPQPDVDSRPTDPAAGLPSDALEYQLQQLWQRVLKRKHLNCHDNFFDLGGHSLLAVRLFAEIERVMRRRLPLATLFEAPTIAGLADVMRREGWTPRWQSLVAIHPQGSRPPLFCVHAHGGHVLIYRDLARYLGADQPVYGLQAAGLVDGSPTPATVEQMASQYLEEVRSLQIEGPYHICGYCSGGVIAYEMARQLHESNQAVGLVALFDTLGPGYSLYPSGLPWWQRRLYDWVRQTQLHWHDLRMLPGPARVDYFNRRAGNVVRAMKQGLKKRLGNAAGYLGEDGSRALPNDLELVQRTLMQANRRYVPPAYPGRVVLFRAKHLPLGAQTDSSLGWRAVSIGELTISELAGFYGATILEPGVRALAGLLAEELRRGVRPAGSLD